MPESSAYILCTSPRSGSTLLCSLLKDTGVAGQPESYFHTASLDDWREGVDLPVPGPPSDTDSLGQILTAVRRKGENGTGVFGLRLQRGSFDFLVQQLDRLYPGHSRVMDRFEAAFGPTRLIHLTRTDKLAQAVSFVRAQQSGLWHKAVDGTELERLAPPREEVYSRTQIAEAFTDFERLDTEWETWFAREALAPLRLTYDQLSGDPREAVARVLAHVGSVPHMADGLEPQVAKLADALSADWIARFRANTR